MTPRHLEFPRMVDILKPTKKGSAEIDHFVVTEEIAKWGNLRCAFGGDRYGYVKPGTYARLLINGGCVMSDTQMERLTNMPFLYNAHGRVLIAGLGLGMIIHGALQKPEVESIDVLEINRDVIDLVGPSVRGPKVHIIHADALTWKLPAHEKWDTIYFDIWGNISGDNLESATKLNRKFARRLNRTNPRAWMGGWRIAELRARSRR